MLSEQISGYFIERMDALARRFFPDFQLPGFFAGYRQNLWDAPDVLYNLALLHQMGQKNIAGTPIPQAMTKVLRQVDGEAVITFWSHRVAEALAVFGPFNDNPLLADLTDAERENVLNAVDSTHIYNPEADNLRGYPNNYWAVLARCEWARQQLGVLPDMKILDRAIAKSQEILFANDTGFFDDSILLDGRYDIYSADTHLFLEPMWPRFDQVRLRQNLAGHVRLAELAAMKNGATIGWGRSIGALSVCLTLELHATALKLGLAADPQRSWGLMQHAFEQFKTWMADDLIDAHRYRQPFKYRGPARLLQMTLDCLGKLAYVAMELSFRGIPGEGRGGEASMGEGSVATGAHSAITKEPSPYPLPEYRERDVSQLFPPVDELIRFDHRGAAVWLFRNEKLSFQLPIVAHPMADYVPWLHAPGLLENPVDSDMLVGVPRIAIGHDVFTVSGRAAGIEKLPNGITIRYGKLTAAGDRKGEAPPTMPGRCSISYRIERETIHGRIELEIDRVPNAVTFDIPEARQPLVIHADAGRHTIVNLEGSPPYRSFWGELKRWHQVTLTPAKSITLNFTLRPVVRVVHAPADHDYNRSLMDAMPAGEVVETHRPNGTCYSQMGLDRFLSDADIFHVGWPEHLIAPHGLSEADHDKRIADFVEKLGRSGRKVVWTMHNRIPHHWPAERGRALYRLWAPVVDGVIHHSRWGMELMRRELPYKPTAKHVVIPHGHFGAMMSKLDRRELEAKYGLTSCVMRFGLLGRPQKEKQFDLIIRAFLAAEREDQQLVLTAGPKDPPPVEHPRVKVIVKDGMVPRQVISEHNQLCDVLVSAHHGESYLTSGVPADAIGLGSAMFVPEWEYFRETLGDAAVYHDNSEARLTELFRNFTVEQMRAKKVAMAALQPQYAWSRLAEMTLELYRSL